MVGSKIHWLARQDPTKTCTLSALHPLCPALPGLPWCCQDNLAQACIRDMMCPVSPCRLMPPTPGTEQGCRLGTDTLYRD